MKKAFSLAEILISMMILSVLFLAGSKVLTQPRKDEISRKVHGTYECYYKNNNVLTQAMSKTGEPVEGIPATEGCVFTPARDSSMYGITVIFADRKGDKTFSTFYNTRNMSITPPTVDNNTATFFGEDNTTQPISPEKNAPNINDEDYKAIMNKVLTYGKNIHVNDDNVKAGDVGQNGAVIIIW